MDPLFVSSMAVLLAIISNVASIWGNVKRRPSLDREIAQFLTTTEHHSLCKESTDELWTRINGDRLVWEAEFRSIRMGMKEDSEVILRAIGRLEGQLNAKD